MGPLFCSHYVPSIFIRKGAKRNARTVTRIKEGLLTTVEKEIERVEAKVYVGVRSSGDLDRARASGWLI